VAIFMEKSKKNSIAKNIIHLFYSTALSSVLNAAALIVLAYYLQSYYYGMFSVVLAFAMIMGYFTDAGLSDIVLREGSKKEVNTSILISSYVKMRLGLLVVTFLCGFFFIHLSNSGHQELIQTAYFLIIPMVTGVALQSIGTTYFQLIEKMQYYGLIRIISSVCLVLTLSVGMIFHLNPLFICTLYGLSYLTAGIIGVYLVSKNVQIRLTSPFHKGLLQNLGSFTLGGLIFVMLPQLGPLVLEKTITLKEVGLFAVAYRIPQALQQIPFIVAGAYYPVLFRSFNNNLLDDHLRYNIELLKIISLVGMAITIPFYYMSDYIIDLLFGEEWIQAALPLKILSLMLTLQAINIALADGLTSRALQSYRTGVQFITVISGIFLYMFFSKSFGVTGAAFAGVIIEVIAFLGFWICIPNRWIIAKRVIIPYLTFFIFCLGSIDFFLDSIPFLAVAIHFILLALVVVFDKENMEKINGYLKPLGINQKWKSKKSEGG
jgi:O-antigen/teichoic acid export membrane protein